MSDFSPSIEFGSPESILASDILDYVETALIDGYFEPPIPLDGLAKSLRANTMHSSGIHVKRNMLSAIIKITEGKLSRKDLYP